MLPPAESLKLLRCQYLYFCTGNASKLTRTAAATADAADAAYVSIRLHTCIRQHTSAYVSIRQHTSADAADAAPAESLLAARTISSSGVSICTVVLVKQVK